MDKDKKSILISFPGSMELGGIERSLLGLLDAIDYQEYDVDLFLYGHHGPLFPLINTNVNLMPEVKELAYLRESLKSKLMNGCFYSVFFRMSDELLKPIRPIDFDKTWAKIMRKKAPVIDKHYDLALGFFRPFDFILEKVNADIKVGWVHTDYSTEKNDLSVLERDYGNVDCIVAVSEQCRNSFLKMFPKFDNKTTVVENILSQSFVQEQSNLFTVKDEMPDKGIKLLSIGRYCTAKNFDNVPEICSNLVSKGLDVYWYLIGFGSDEQLIKDKIEQFGMQDRVILLGKKENPYPYISACDYYIQPSRYEGKAVTVREAQMLCKPVVITKYATSSSQLEDGIDGIIVPMDNKGCADGIARLINDKELTEKLISNCKNRDYSNSEEIKKIYSLTNYK